MNSIHCPNDWSIEKEFDILDCILEPQAFIEKEKIESEFGLWGISVNSRY